MFLTTVILGVAALAVNGHSSGLTWDFEKTRRVPFYEMQGPRPLRGQYADFYPREHRFPLRAEDWPGAIQFEGLESEEEWENDRSAENAMHKARRHKRDNQASLSRYYYEWPSSTGDADYREDQEEMKGTRPSSSHDGYKDRQSIDDGSGEAPEHHVFGNADANDRNEVNNDEQTKLTEEPVLAESTTAAQPKQQIQKEGSEPKPNGNTARLSARGVSAGPEKVRGPVPPRNSQTTPPEAGSQQWQWKPSEELKHGTMGREISEVYAEVQPRGSAEVKERVAASSLLSPTSEAKQVRTDAYNGQDRRAKAVPAYEGSTASEPSVKGPFPPAPLDDVSSSFAKGPNAGNNVIKETVEHGFLRAGNGESGSLPVQQEVQSARDELSYNVEVRQKDEPFTEQSAPTRSASFTLEKEAYEQEPEDPSESKREGQKHLRVMRRLAESSIAGLGKSDESIPLRRHFWKSKPSSYGYSRPAAASYHSRNNLLHKERYQDAPAAAAIDDELPAYRDETAVAFQPRLYGPSSPALGDGGFIPGPLGVEETDSQRDQMANLGASIKSTSAHQPELTGLKPRGPMYVPRPRGSLDMWTNQRSRGQEASATPGSKFVNEPAKEVPSKAGSFHVSGPEKSATPLSSQNRLAFGSGEIKNGFGEKIRDRASPDLPGAHSAHGAEPGGISASPDIYQERSKLGTPGSAERDLVEAGSAADRLGALILPNMASAPIRMAISEMISGLKSKASEQGTTPKAPPEQPSYEGSEGRLPDRKGEPPAVERTALSKQDQVTAGTGGKVLDHRGYKPALVTGERYSDDLPTREEASLYNRPSHKTKPESSVAADLSPYSAGDGLDQKPAYVFETSRHISAPARQISVMRRPDRLDFELQTKKPIFEVHYGPASRKAPRKFSGRGKDTGEKIGVPNQQLKTPSKSASYSNDAYGPEHEHRVAPQNHIRPLHWLGLPPYISGDVSGSAEQRRASLKQAPAKSEYGRRKISDGEPIAAAAGSFPQAMKLEKARTASIVPVEPGRGSIADKPAEREYASKNLMKFASTKAPLEEAAVRRVQLHFEPPEPSVQGPPPRQLPAKVLADIVPARSPGGAATFTEDEASKYQVAGQAEMVNEPEEHQPHERTQKVLPHRYGAVKGLKGDGMRQPDYDERAVETMRAGPGRGHLENGEKPAPDQYRLKDSRNRTAQQRPEYNDQESAEHTAAYEPPASVERSKADTRREGARQQEVPGETVRAFQKQNVWVTSKTGMQQDKAGPHQLAQKLQQQQIPRDGQPSLQLKPEPPAQGISKERLTGTGLGKSRGFEAESERQEGSVSAKGVEQGRQASDLPLTQTFLPTSTPVSKTEGCKSEKENERITSAQKVLSWESLTIPPFVPFLAKDGGANSGPQSGGGQAGKLLDANKLSPLVKTQFEKTVKESLKLEAIPTVAPAHSEITPRQTVATTQQESPGSPDVSPIFSLWGLQEKKWIDFNNGLREARVQSISVTNQPWRPETGERKEDKGIRGPSASGFSPFNLAGKLLQANLASFLEDKPLAGEYMNAPTPGPEKSRTTETKA